MANLAIRQLVDTIVDTQGARCNAVDELARLETQLAGEMEACTDHAEKQRVRCDLEFVRGYAETPAALIADLIGAKARARQ